MVPPLERLVDLDRYPVGDLDGPVARAVIDGARAQLAGTGAVELPGFLTPEGVAGLVADAEDLARRAHRSEGVGTAYLEYPDFSLPEDHPRLTWGHYAVGAVAYDLMPDTSLLRRIYEWPPLLALVREILDRGPLYRYADPFGALNLAVMGDGDELQWHFDQTDFVVSLAVQSAERGGDFEVVPRIRSADYEAYGAVAAVLGGDRSGVVTLPMTPGTLLVFEGRHSLHRVSPVGGPRLRHMGLLAFDTVAGTQGSELLRRTATVARCPSRPRRWHGRLRNRVRGVVHRLGSRGGPPQHGARSQGWSGRDGLDHRPGHPAVGPCGLRGDPPPGSRPSP